MASGLKLGTRRKVAAALVALVTGACGGGDSSGPPTVSVVEVSPATGTVEVGFTIQLAAAAKSASGTVLTRPITWTSTNPAAATVSQTGLVTGVSPATVNVTATADGRTGTSQIVVILPAVVTVAVTLPVTELLAGLTAQATATLRDARGAPLTGRVIVWSSSNNAVATVNSTGLVTAVGAGDVAITATSEGRNGSVNLRVLPPPVASVSVTLGNASLRVGESTQAQAVLKDAAGNTLSGRVVSWSSSAPTVATVSPTGQVTGVSNGLAVITAASESKTGTATVAVPVDWTVMVFLAGDNNLAKPGIDDLDEMEEIGSSSTMKVVVQAEYSGEWLRENGITSPAQVGRPNWNTFRYVLPARGTAAPRLGPNGTVEDIGNRDMTSPAQLREFIAWAKQTAPARRYLLVLWNHGNGAGGLLADETTNPGRLMTLSEMRTALTGDTPIDLVDFDMCLMATFETVVALRGVARTAVFSEEVVPGEGNDYREVLRTVEQNFGISTTEMAARVADAFINGYSTNPRPSLTMSAVNIEAADPLIAAVNTLGTTLNGLLPQNAVQISQAIANAQNYSTKWVRDVGNAADSLRARTTGGTQALIDAVKSELSKPAFMLRNRIRLGNASSSLPVARSTGLSIVFPALASSDALPSAGESSLASYAAQMPNSGWTTFLRTYLSSAPSRAFVDVGTQTLQTYIIWSLGDLLNTAEIDFLVAEPGDNPNSVTLQVPWFGSVTPNGTFTPDSYDSRTPMEGWSSKRYVASGTYFFFAWLYDDPNNVRPAVQLYHRFGTTGAFTARFQGTLPRLQRAGLQWYRDPGLTLEKMATGQYTDLIPIINWTPAGGGNGRLAPLGDPIVANGAGAFSRPESAWNGGASPRITAAQVRTLEAIRAARAKMPPRNVSPAVRDQLLRQLQSLTKRQ
ncbi:MAG: clostripain-related cysteine peptidase [Gemmatimonadaceae bacterium]